MKVINGNNIELLKQYADNHFDAVVTDPPYGLGKEPDATELLKDWVDHGYHEISGTGFMGKEWDAFVPQPLFWKEVFRVLKPGGHVLAFYGTRTYDWGVLAMRLAGFEVRDSIYWHYGCLSEDTEILTKSGYIQYHKFIKLPNFEQQEILIYDSENDFYKWEKPERWNQYNINKDTCYRVKSNSTDQIVSRNHRCLVEREGKLIFIQAEMLSEMEYMPTLSDDFFVLDKKEPELLWSNMQRISKRARMEKTRKQRKKSVVRRNKRKLSFINNWREKSCLERGNYISQEKGILFGSKTQICEVSERVYYNGEKRRVCNGISFDNGKTDRQTTFEDGVCASYRSQSNEQRYIQSNAIFNKQRTQEIRMGRSYSTTLATITPFEYSGVIFCPTTSTGSFVARRNGKVFLTGNSGFPKSHNIGKAIDKLEGNEREVVGDSSYTNHDIRGKNGLMVNDGAKRIRQKITKGNSEWEGWGSALKPATEPIVLARKPLEKGLSIAENVLKWGTGGINIDGCRVGTIENLDSNGTTKKFSGSNNNRDSDGERISYEQNALGRFPANLILTHHPECECKGLKKVKTNKNIEEKGTGGIWQKSSGLPCGNQYGDENGEETIEHWECHPECPIKIMDEQSGILKSGQLLKGHKRGSGITSYDGGGGIIQKDYGGDSGGASRFFYCAKASRSERNNGLRGFEVAKDNLQGLDTRGRTLEREDGSKTLVERWVPKPRANNHPTVKPVKLMQYLVRMITPPNGLVLDPFCGSGTTGIACKLEGIEFLGMEQDAEYCKIAEARIENYTEEPEEVLELLPDEENKKPVQTTLF